MASTSLKFDFTSLTQKKFELGECDKWVTLPWEGWSLNPVAQAYKDNLINPAIAKYEKAELDGSLNTPIDPPPVLETKFSLHVYAEGVRQVSALSTPAESKEASLQIQFGNANACPLIPKEVMYMGVGDFVWNDPVPFQSNRDQLASTLPDTNPDTGCYHYWPDSVTGCHSSNGKYVPKDFAEIMRRVGTNIWGTLGVLGWEAKKLPNWPVPDSRVEPVEQLPDPWVKPRGWTPSYDIKYNGRITPHMAMGYWSSVYYYPTSLDNDDPYGTQYETPEKGFEYTGSWPYEVPYTGKLSYDNQNELLKLNQVDFNGPTLAAWEAVPVPDTKFIYSGRHGFFLYNLGNQVVGVIEETSDKAPAFAFQHYQKNQTFTPEGSFAQALEDYHTDLSQVGDYESNVMSSWTVVNPYQTEHMTAPLAVVTQLQVFPRIGLAIHLHFPSYPIYNAMFVVKNIGPNGECVPIYKTYRQGHSGSYRNVVIVIKDTSILSETDLTATPGVNVAGSYADWGTKGQIPRFGLHLEDYKNIGKYLEIDAMEVVSGVPDLELISEADLQAHITAHEAENGPLKWKFSKIGVMLMKDWGAGVNSHGPNFEPGGMYTTHTDFEGEVWASFGNTLTYLYGMYDASPDRTIGLHGCFRITEILESGKPKFERSKLTADDVVMTLSGPPMMHINGLTTVWSTTATFSAFEGMEGIVAAGGVKALNTLAVDSPDFRWQWEPNWTPETFYKGISFEFPTRHTGRNYIGDVNINGFCLYAELKTKAYDKDVLAANGWWIELETLSLFSPSGV